MYNSSSKYKFIFLLFDCISIILSFLIFYLFFDLNYIFLKNVYFLIFLVVITLILNLFTEEYRYIEIRGYLKELKYSVIYALKVVVVTSFLLIINKNDYLQDLIKISFITLIVLFLINFLLSYFLRLLSKIIFKYYNKVYKSALLFYSEDDNNLLENIISKDFNIVGYINLTSKINFLKGKPVLKNLSEVKKFIIENNVDEIFLNTIFYDESDNFFKGLKLLGIPISLNVNNLSSNYTGEYVVKNINKSTFITSAIKIVTLRQVFLKRIIDILGAMVGIILTFFVALIIYPIVQKESPGPLIFKQKRVGKNGKVFNIYKFRSMYLDAEDRKKELMQKNDLDTTLMFKMKDDPRIFPFGKKLRDWSIDELPQFINVLKGDMSLVGTRPPTVDEYKQYEIHHFRRLSVKPGITGLWQVNGRSNIENFETVVELDLQYIREWSISMDIKILFKTLKVVLTKEGSR